MSMRQLIRICEMQFPATKRWFHGTANPDVKFALDRPAFFAAEVTDAADFGGKTGFIVEATLDMHNAIDEEGLMDVGVVVGVVKNADELYSAEYEDFPDVSSFLDHSSVRRHLEKMGHDGFWGVDGYFEAAVVWNPKQITVINVRPR